MFHATGQLEMRAAPPAPAPISINRSPGAHIEAIERVRCEGVRERLKHLFVHRNVIVPEFGVLVWLELRR